MRGAAKALVLLGTACAALACGGGGCDGCAPPAPLCDGSPGLRMAALVLPSPSRLPPGNQVVVENGSTFLYVDGGCRYWALRAGQTKTPVRTGVLDADGAAHVTEALFFGRWSDWAGQWTPGGGASDASPYVFYEGPGGRPRVDCLRGCDGKGPPEEVRRMAANLDGLVASLGERGQDASGPMRFLAIHVQDLYSDIPEFDWPLVDVDLASVSVPEQQAAELTYGLGRATTEEQGAALRELRARYAAHPISTNYAYVPVKDAQGRHYQLYLRDALPLEDARGLVRPPEG